jgi:hypothetical protein
MKFSLFATAILALSGTLAMAQTAPVIHHRQENQQDRIGQGVRSGQLTAHETARLERREASIHREERNMRRADNGHLSRADRAALTRRQNRTSHAIYRDKHNARVR